MGTSSNYIKEKDIVGGITSINSETLEKINEQVKKCSCKIECNGKGNGSGFFSLIPFPKKTRLLPVLMTNNHVLPKEDIINGKKIKINMNNSQLNILIDDSRRVYTDEKYDITIIEINENDRLDINTFLEIDDSIYKENPYEYFKKRSVYLIHHPKSNDEPEFAVGIIKGIELSTKEIAHTCKSERGSSGSPILDFKTNKIIGIHKGANKNNQNWNVGTFIKEPIEKFYEKVGNIAKPNEISNKNQIREKVIKNINNIQNQDNYNNNKLELKSKSNNINIEKVNNIHSYNEFSVFDKDNIDNNEFNIFNPNNNSGDFIKKNNDKNSNDSNNNILKSKTILNNNNIKNNDDIISNNKINNNDILISNNYLMNYKSDEINNNINNNIDYILNNEILMEKEEKNGNFIDEVTIKYKKKNFNATDLILKAQLFGLKESSSNDKLFGEKFVENNKNLCKIIIGDKEYELKSFLNKECDEVKKKEFEIKLKGISNITDLSFMFCGCLSLDSIQGFSNINTSKITNLSFLFSFCKITSIPDISKWDTSNVKYMNHMFLHCFDLKSISDISKWNTSKVINIKGLFTDCYKLQYLPDISKWDTNNIESMNLLFAGCESLKSLPDISKWKTKKIKSLKGVFSSCYKLVNLPDISKWDTSEVIDMSKLFNNCTSLKTLPDISRWNTSKVISMKEMFTNCRSLVFLPDISKWNTINVQNMYAMFSYCKNLVELPDISKWNITNVKYKSNMFFSCKKNLNIPEKFKLNPISNVFGFYEDKIKDAMSLKKLFI